MVLRLHQHSTRVTGFTAHENMDNNRQLFPPAAGLTRVTLETSFHHLEPSFSHHNLGNSKSYRKYFGILQQYNFYEK